MTYYDNNTGWGFSFRFWGNDDSTSHYHLTIELLHRSWLFAWGTR